MAQLIRLAGRPAGRGDEHASSGSEDDPATAATSTSQKGFLGGSALARLSEAEIGQLVSVALEDALIALGQDDPEASLRLRARSARAEMHESFASLPFAQRSDPTVVSEYRKALVFRALTLELALKLVSVIERYADACAEESPSSVG